MGDVGVPVPHQIQRRAWEAAYELRTNFADRLDILQNIRMEVLIRMEPQRLGWKETGEALALWTLVVEVRV